MKLHRKCPLCGNVTGEYLQDVEINFPEDFKKQVVVPQSYMIVSCEKCGMVYADTTLTREDLDTYYSSFNMYDNVSNVKKEIYNESCEKYFEVLSPFIEKSDRILDLGCGSGVFLTYLRSKGFYNLWGMDPSIDSVNELEQKGINGILGNVYDSVHEYVGMFDVVLFTGVLEHLLFPNIAISTLKSYIRNSGIVFIALPNVEGFEKYLREVPNYFNREHINYYSSTSLDETFMLKKMKRVSSDEALSIKVVPKTPELIACAVYKIEERFNYSLIYDDKGKNSVIKYFSKIKQIETEQKNLIKDFILRNERIMVWGTGSLSDYILKRNAEILERIECFIDNDVNKQEHSFLGKRVISPSILKNEEYECIPILICVMLSPETILKQIKKMELTNEILVFEQL